MKIFDTHCHLNHDDLYFEAEKYIKEANKVGVIRFLVVGYDLKTSLRAVELAEKFEGVYAAVGVHPTEIDLSEQDFNKIMNLLRNPKVVALGEIGLDYHWVKDEKQREKQKEYFIRQIKIANEHHLPISIHSRDADKDTLDILKDNHLEKGGIMHCYSGSVESANEIIKLGLLISLGGPVTFLNAKTPKEIAKKVPLNKMLVETDAPYLTPHPYRGKTNTPKHIVLVVEEIARLKNISPLEVAEKTYENANELFHV
ncbi:MAG: TatD family hydrolase [Erysipelotrichaceae bacterium]|jgi:TatD DNase family protein|nr:TatD family hydrolase [Erysipelotrichaceae bacterium]